MGIGVEYADADYHPGNGKAERTGKKLKEWMSRSAELDERNWVECLSAVRQMYHDTAWIM